MAAGAKRNTIWLSWIAFIGGLWLIISPFILGYSIVETAVSNDLVVGVIVSVLALVSILWKQTSIWLSWVIVLIGVWEVVSPFFLNHASSILALGNAIVIGIILIVFAGWRLLSLQEEEPILIEEYGPTFHFEERKRK